MQDIHAQLRADAWMDRWLGTPIMGLISAGIFVAVGVGTVKGNTPLPLLLLGSAIGLLFAWAAWYSWECRRWYQRVTWVLEHTEAREATARFLYAEPDSVHLTLRHDGAAVAEHCMPCCLPSWIRSLGANPVVQAHIDPQPGGPIVVVTTAGIIWPLARTPSTMVAAHAPASSDNPFAVLEQRLREQGLAQQAGQLSAVSNGTFTSSSELLGEYGSAMQAVKACCWRRMDGQTRQAYAAAAKAVHAGWPSMRL